MRRAIGFVVLAAALIVATSGIARRDAQDAEITAKIEREAYERKTDLPPRQFVPIAHDAMTWQVVNGRVRARFYCSSRCQRELDAGGR